MLAKKFHLVSWCILAVLIVQMLAFAEGKVEHHQITSQILADASQPTERGLSVYLPEGYDALGLAYPVLYLLHGHTFDNPEYLSNTTFLGDDPSMPDVNAAIIADKLIENGEVSPLILVFPDIRRVWGIDKPYHNYIVDEVIPFVEAEYSTIQDRQNRAIAGHSRGALDAFDIALTHPDLFSLVGALSGAFPEPVPDIGYGGSRVLLKAHDQDLFPLQFWIYAGTNDDFDMDMTSDQLVEILEQLNLSHTYITDDGDHFNRIAQRLEESMIFFSARFGGAVTSIEAQGKLTTTWGKLKQNR